MNGLITRSVARLSADARTRRAALFREAFVLTAETRILDLGSQWGVAINAVLSGTPVKPENTYIADINPEQLERGRVEYGYVPVLVNESGKLPFPDGYFDIVYCSSVIEHVTLPKDLVWVVRSGREFRERSMRHQQEFAREIQRVGRQFFVQTPYRWFVIESHTWLPFFGYLPRRLQIPAMRAARSFWPTRAHPDFNLLDRRQLAGLFDGANIRDEKWMGMTKSIMAIKSERHLPISVLSDSGSMGLVE